MTFDTLEDLKRAGTVKQALERIANDTRSTEVDEVFIRSIITKGFPSAVVTYGLVYLEPPCPPISLAQFASMVLGTKAKSEDKPTLAPLPPQV